MMSQRKRKISTTPKNTGGVNIFTVGIDNFFGDGKSQTGACFVLSAGDIRFIETIPDVWKAFFRNADAVIADSDKDFIFLYGSLYLNGRIR